MPSADKLLNGFRVFKSTTYNQKKDMIEHLLKQGQKPSTMIISCSEIRIPPAEIFSTNPGELYIVNNIGGLVPKYDTTAGVHGIMSAIEYAVKNLEVENIIVLGHSKCNGIKMILSDQFANNGKLSTSMKAWLSIAEEARAEVKADKYDDPEKEQFACEHESLIISLKNLMGYPYVAERLSKNKINLFAWHFDITTGDISAYNPDSGFFENLS